MKRVIPQFPTFKKLELSDKKEVQGIISQYPPYSDYNFVSLWSYNTQDKIEISLLNGNLVVLFTDYMTNEPFYSFIGNKRIKETIATLLEHAQITGISQVLKLIPEHNLHNKTDLKFHYHIVEDTDNHDYILSVQELKHLKGDKFRAKRNFVNRFTNKYPHIFVRELDLQDKSTIDQISALLKTWQKNKKATDKDIAIEFTAIKRLLEAANQLDIIAGGLFDNEKLIGFSINELTHEKHGVIHFEKADIHYVGIFQYLKQVTAHYLDNVGYKYINYEQDLGIEGLRKAKQSYHPISHLKKYSIRRR